jgi:hypothetical protein
MPTADGRTRTLEGSGECVLVGPPDRGDVLAEQHRAWSGESWSEYATRSPHSTAIFTLIASALVG